MAVRKIIGIGRQYKLNCEISRLFWSTEMPFGNSLVRARMYGRRVCAIVSTVYRYSRCKVTVARARIRVCSVRMTAIAFRNSYKTKSKKNDNRTMLIVSSKPFIDNLDTLRTQRQIRPTMNALGHAFIYR